MNAQEQTEAGKSAGAFPRLAVLPFDALSPDTEMLRFARGFAEDLSAELGRFAALRVIHPASVFALAAEPGAPAAGAAPGADARESLARLRADYWVRGSVRRDPERIRVTAQLLEVRSGEQRWAERFEADAAEFFALQDHIAARVAGAVVLRMDDARLERARRQPLADLAAYDCWLRGVDLLRQGSVEADADARAHFARALEIDPHFARAHAGISLSHFNEWSCQAWEWWDEKERLAFAAARRAAELDDSDHIVQLVLARIELYRREFERAERHVELALRLNPNDADALIQAALICAYLGTGERAIELADRALELNPCHPDWYLGFAAFPRLIARRYAEGLELARRAPEVTVDFAAYRAVALAHLGDLAAARRDVAQFLAVFREKILFGREPEPGEPLRWLLHVGPFRRAADAEHLAEGLRLAGLDPDPDDPRIRSGTAIAPAAETAAEFGKDGALWTAAYGGRRVQLTEVKGFWDLARLLDTPGQEWHCLTLAGAVFEGGEADVLDPRARRELEARIGELQAELDRSEERNDLGGAEAARRELDSIVETLSHALGLGGRSRRLGSASERARSAVTWRIRSAIRKLGAAHPELGRHFENAIKTGTYCSYRPERPVAWQVSTGSSRAASQREAPPHA